MSDLDQSELKLGVHYAHTTDRDFWLFAWNPFDYTCRDKITTISGGTRMNHDRRVDIYREPGNGSRTSRTSSNGGTNGTDTTSSNIIKPNLINLNNNYNYNNKNKTNTITTLTTSTATRPASTITNSTNSSFLILLSNPGNGTTTREDGPAGVAAVKPVVRSDRLRSSWADRAGAPLSSAIRSSKSRSSAASESS